MPPCILEPVGLPMMQHAQGSVGTHVRQLIGGTPRRGALLSRFLCRFGLARLAPSRQAIVTGCVLVELSEGLALLASSALLLIFLLGRAGTALLLVRRFLGFSFGFDFGFGFDLLGPGRIVNESVGRQQLIGFPLEVCARLFAFGHLLPELFVGYLEFVDLVFETCLDLVPLEYLSPELPDRYLGMAHQFGRIGPCLLVSTPAGLRDFGGQRAFINVACVSGDGYLPSSPL
jgi:hypothetical protein